MYESVIGLEVHIELSTKSKIFCGCAVSFGDKPNTHICPVCMGMPGALPVLNKRVADYAIAVGLALDCDISRRTVFDRKNYFYPDNPQNYQISQLYIPICTNGALETDTKSGKKSIGIHEIHMEEDAGGLTHDAESNATLIDFNRAGVPLIEIVTKPDMRNASEVIAFLEKLKLSIQYLEVSDCKMNEGSMRVDVNLSVKKRDSDKYGVRTEMKNLNSFKAISAAIEHESKRQISILSSGGRVMMQTRRWDDAKGTSFPMRSKEEARDYRYFPDPDLVPLMISDEWIDSIKDMLPEFAHEKKERYIKELSLSDKDAELITSDKHLAEIFEVCVGYKAKPKQVANWLGGECMRILNERGKDIKSIRLNPKSLARLITLTEEGVLNHNMAKEVFAVMFDNDIDIDSYVKEHGMATLTDEDKLRSIAHSVIEANPKSVSDYKDGKKKASGYLMGQIMKETSGKADPVCARRILEEILYSS